MHPNIQILLFFGGTKAAKDIIKGDILIGSDSHPRIVMSVSKNVNELYTITPALGEPFIISDKHQLVLHNEFTNSTSFINVTDYILKTPTWKSKHKLQIMSVNYQNQAVKNDPYLVGLLLASETKSVDDVVKDYLSDKIAEIARSINAGKTSMTIESIDKEEIGYLLNHRYIPDEYLYNSTLIRQKIYKGYKSTTDFITKKKNANKSIPSNIRHTRGKSQSKPSSRSNSRTRRSLTPVNIARKSNGFKLMKISKDTKPSTTNLTETKRPVQISNLSVTHLRGRARSNAREMLAFNVSNTAKSTIQITEFIIDDNILREQFKFLVRSLGASCDQNNNKLIVDNTNLSIDTDSKTPAFTLSDFTIAPYATEECHIFTTNGDGTFILASCIVSCTQVTDIV